MRHVGKGRLLAALGLLAATACGGGSDHDPPDAAVHHVDAAPADAHAADGAPSDGAPADGAPADGAPADGAPADAGIDAAIPPLPPDAAPADASLPDAPSVTPDSGSADASLPDAGLPPPPLGGAVVTVARATSSFDGPSWLVRVPLDGDPATNLTNPADTAFPPILAKDSQRLFYVGATAGHARSIFTVPVDGSAAPTDLIQDPPQFPPSLQGRLELSADGQRLYVYSNGSTLFALDVHGGPLEVVGAGVQVWGFGPQGQPVFTRAGASHDELVVTCADHDCAHSPLGPDEAVDSRTFAVSPDHRHVAITARHTGAASHALWILDLPSETVRTLAPAVDDQAELLWSPDSSRLSYLTVDGTHSQTHIACPDGSCDVTVPTPFVYSTGLFSRWWSPDSGHLAIQVYAGGVRLLSACADGTCAHVVPAPIDPVYSDLGVSWSPDGHLLHLGIPGSPDVATPMVADCADLDCPTIAWAASRLSFAPAWAGERLGYSDAQGIWVRDGLTGAPRRLQPVQYNLIGFDATGQHLFYRVGPALGSSRIDGLGGALLDQQVLPAVAVLDDPAVLLP